MAQLSTTIPINEVSSTRRKSITVPLDDVTTPERRLTVPLSDLIGQEPEEQRSPRLPPTPVSPSSVSGISLDPSRARERAAEFRLGQARQGIEDDVRMVNRHSPARQAISPLASHVTPSPDVSDVPRGKELPPIPFEAERGRFKPTRTEPQGPIIPGNIDLFKQPRVKNDDDTISTVRSMSFGEDGYEILIPTVVNGKVVSDDEAIQAYEKTGKHLGKFADVKTANAAAEKLHEDYAAGVYDPPRPMASHAPEPILTPKDRAFAVPDIPEHFIGPEPEKGELGFVDFFKGLVDTEKKALTPKGEELIPWTGVITQGVRAYDVIRAARRVRDGNDTDADRRILEDYVAQDAEAQKRGTNIAYDAANTAAHIPSFAVEFAATGGAFTGVKKLVEEAVAKVVARKAARVAAGYAAGAVAQTAAMPQRIVAEALRRQAPTVKDINEGLSDWDDDFLPALAKAIPDQFIEVFSERTGGAFEGVGGKLFAKLPLPARVKAVKAAIAEQWLKLHPGSTVADFLSKVKEETGWNGVIGEMVEERVGEAMRAVLPFLHEEGQQQPAMVRVVTGEGGRAQAAQDLAYQLVTEAVAFAVPGASAKAIKSLARPRTALEDAQGGASEKTPPVRTTAKPSAAQALSPPVPPSPAAEPVLAMTPAVPPPVPASAAGTPPAPAAAEPVEPAGVTTQDERHAQAMARIRIGGPPNGLERRGVELLEDVKPQDAEPHDHSSTQVNLPDGLATSVRALGAQIADDDLAGDGRETTPHVTVLYGLTTEDAEKVREVLANEPPVTVTLGKTSVFPASEADGQDVVKIDVDSPDLHRLNAKLAAARRHATTHPEYRPHVTLGYVRAGRGEHYAGDASLEGQTVTLDRIVFSAKDGTVTELPLAGKKGAFDAAEVGLESEGDLGERRGAAPLGQVSTEAGGRDRAVEREGASVEGPHAAAEAEVAPVVTRQAVRGPRLLVVDTVSGASRDAESTSVALGRKEVLVEEVISGAGKILKAGDQVTPTGRTKIKRGDYTSPEAATTATVEPVATAPERPPVQATVRPNVERQSVEIKFPSKPDQAVLDKLKAAGYRWAATNKVWYRKRKEGQTSPGAVEEARTLLGLTKTLAPTTSVPVTTPVVGPATPAVEVAADMTDEELAASIMAEVAGEQEPAAAPSQTQAATKAPQFQPGDEVEIKDYDGKWYRTKVSKATDEQGRTQAIHPNLRMQPIIPGGGKGGKAIAVGPAGETYFYAKPDEIRSVSAAAQVQPAAQTEQPQQGQFTSSAVEDPAKAKRRAERAKLIADLKADLKNDPQFSAPKPVTELSGTERTKLQKELQTAYDTMPTVGVGSRDLPFYDTGKRLTEDEMMRLVETAAVRRLIDTVTTIADDIVANVLDEAKTGVERIGVLLDQDAYGVFWPDPTSSSRATILLNPFERLRRMPAYVTNKPSEMADAVYTTAVHEATHWLVKGEGKDFLEAYEDNLERLGQDYRARAHQQLTEAYADHDNPTAIRPDIAQALSLYSESRGRQATAPDALSRAGGYETRPTDETGGSAEAVAGTGRDRVGTPTAHVTPQRVVSMVKILRTYIDDEMSFQEAVSAFQDDFGPGARTLDRHFEIAWQKLQGQKVSVADALAVAQNVSREATDVRNVPDGAGQLSERGEPTARGGGTQDVGALDTVPAESGAGTAQEGPPSAGDGGSASVVAGGVSDDADAGSQSEPPPAPDRGTLSGAALSPSGATSQSPGVRPPDYTLTPDRIAAIIRRGTVQRVKDNLAAIEIVKALRTEKRYATADEQEALAKYVGWGATEAADFIGEYPKYNWSANEKALWKRIQEATTPEERLGMADSTNNAHFTYDLYRPIWSALERAGFAGGRVLEPAVGSGHAFGFMPPAMRQVSTLNASELDPMTASLVQALYPSARVQAVGYERSRIARGTQDLVISNVPFGAFKVDDPHFKPFITDSVHNYFFAKALDHVRPGGLIVFVTSRYTMDGPESQGVRRYISDRAHFLGAVRLPNTAFDKSAKTKVVTDLIVLQRLHEGETAKNADTFLESPLSEALSSTQYSHGKLVNKNVYRAKWYAEHPELVLGTESNEGKQYGGGEYTVTATTDDILGALDTALKQILPEGTYVPAKTAATDEPSIPTTVEGAFKVGEYRVNGGRVQRVNDKGELVDATPMRFDQSKNVMAIDAAAVARITDMVTVRDSLRSTIAAMKSADATDATIKKAQKAMKKAYDTFVAKHGELNKPINKRLFRDDPESTNLLELERMKPSATYVTNKFGSTTLRINYSVTGLADIFTKRTIAAPVTITKVDTSGDALLASLGTKTAIDWPYMARIAGRSVPTLQADLKAEGRVFEQPDGEWALRESYLSGDVVTKLADAEAAAADDSARYAANIEALKAVQPKDKLPEEITITLGTHWVPPADVMSFVGTELDMRPATIGTMIVDGTETYTRWTLEATDHAHAAGDRHVLAVKYGPGGRLTYGLTALLSDALNLNMPSLGWWEGSGEDRHFVKDPVGTQAAHANLEELRSKWQEWLYANPETLTRLTTTYNTRFNRTVARTFDGTHLNHIAGWNSETKTGTRTAALPGLALEFPLFPHQLSAVWRMLTSGNTLVAHQVGSGKTYEAIIAAMEMRRTGRARKPLITVPTYLLGQWREAILKAYPTARVAAFDEKDLEKSQRQRAMAKIAFGDWDIVLVPHSSFQLLKVSNDRMVSVMQAWIDELMDAEETARHSRGEDHESVKRLAAARKRIQAKVRKKLEAVNKSDDNALTWEQLGVDALFVDEATSFKNLFFFSNMENLRGLSRSESDRALDLYVKVLDINEQSHHRNLFLLTATPVMNSMAELFTMQRYLQPQRLLEQGFENFDNWYRMFGWAVPTTEKRPDGTYQEVMRLRKFRNLDLLHRTMSEVMDYVGWDDMPYLKLPKLKDGKITVVKTEPHPMYDVLQKWFADRLAAIRENPPHVKRDGTYVAPERMDPLSGRPMGKLDNILTVMTDAKLAAVDVRLVLGDRAKDFRGSRMQVAARDMYEVYKREKAKKGVVLVFLDVGTPKEPGPLEFLKGVAVEDQTEGGALGVEEAQEFDDNEVAEADNANGVFNLYDALKDALVKLGVPSKEVAYIHQARNAAERLALFEAANSGKIRFILASTDKGGLGMNIQERLAAMVEFDAPRAMRPGDSTQRLGRIVRQGNSYGDIDVRRYVTKGTTDEWLYGLLGQKSTQINDFMRGTITESEDVDPSSMSLEEAEVMASGDKRGIELIKLRSSLVRLEAQATAVARATGQARAEVQSETSARERDRRDLDAANKWLASGYTPMKGDAFSMEIGGTTYKKRSEANARLIAEMEKVLAGKNRSSTPLATFGGLTVQGRYDPATQSRNHGVAVEFNGEPLHGGDISIDTVRVSDPPQVEEGQPPAAAPKFGEGRDVVAQLSHAYADLPAKKPRLEGWIEEATNRIERSQALLDKPSPAVAKLAEARARIDALELELKLEGAAKDAKLTAERQEQAKELARQTEAGQQAIGPDDGPQFSRVEDDDEEDAAPVGAAMPAGRPPAARPPETVVRRADLTDRQARALRPDQIVEKLARMIGNVPISLGQAGRGNFGLFKGQGAIRLKIAGDFDTTLHELGHAIDGLVMPFSEHHRRGPIAKELKKVGEPTSRPSYDAGQRRREGVAEYIRRWLMEPDVVRAEAPQLTIVFERFLASGHPVAKALADAQSTTQQWMSMSDGEKFDLMVDFGDGHLPEVAEQGMSWALGTYEDPRTGLDRMVSAFSDDKYRLWQMERALKEGVIDPGESVYWLSRLLPGSARRAEGFIKYAVRDAGGKVLGPSLYDALQPRLKHYRDIVYYMVAQRAQRAKERGLETPFTDEWIKDKFAKAKENPEVGAGAVAIGRHRRAFLDYLESENFLPPAMRAKWELAWGDTYLPWKRISQSVAASASGAPRTTARRPRFFRRFRGGKEAIVDPIVTLIEDEFMAVAMATENKFLNELFELADTKGGGAWLEILAPQKAPITFNLQQAKEAVVKAMSDAGVEIEDSVLLDEKFLDQMVTVWTPQKTTINGKHYVTRLLPDGTRQWGEVHDRGLWELLDAHGVQTTSTAIKALGFFARPIRATATLNIPWVLRNLGRDLFSAMLYSPGLFTPAATVRGLKSILREDEDWQLYLHSLAGQSTFNAQDRDVFKRELRRLSMGQLRRWADMTVMHPFDMLAALRELSEQATRVGAAKIQLEAERKSEEGLTEAGLRRVGVVGREVTQDFQKVGSAVRDFNRMSAFLAAGIGGWTRAAEEAKANPGRLATRLIPYLAMAAALWLLTKDDDEYDAVPSSEKKIYHHIPIPNALRKEGWGPFLRLPRPFEFGDIANIVEGYFDWMVKRDPQFAERLPKIAWDQAFNMLLSLAPDAFLPAAEVAANYDLYFEKAIFNPYETDIDKELQYTRWTTETAKGIGGILDIAPWKVDHMLSSYFTGVYRAAAGGAGRLLGNAGILPPPPESVSGVPDALEGVVVEARRAFYNGERVGTADLDEFYDELQRLDGAAKSIRRYYLANRVAKAEERAAEEGLSLTVDNKGVPVVMSARLRQLRQARQKLADLRGPIDETYKSRTMTPADKRQRLNELTEDMVNLARTSLGKSELRRTTERAQIAAGGVP